MTRIEKRVLIRNSLLGIMLTLVVLIADWAGKDGMLSRVENNLYDLRARRFQYFTPLPTDKLVHVSIDDPSLQYIGQWPWSRSMLGNLTEEMRRAGAKAIAFDVLFTEEQEANYQPAQNELEPTIHNDAVVERVVGTFERVDEDAYFAQKLLEFGNAILPASFAPRGEPTPLRTAVYELLLKDLLLGEEEVRQRLVGIDPGDELLAFRTVVSEARKDAIYTRMIRLLDTMPEEDLAEMTEAKLRLRMFPGGISEMSAKLPPGLYSQQYRLATSFRVLRKLARSIPTDLPPMLPVTPALPPIPILASAAKATAFVDHLADRDGVARSIELWRNGENWLYPQMGLMLACATLDVKLQDIELHHDHIVIPKPDGTRLKVPVYSQRTTYADYDVGMFMLLPWFGKSSRDTDWTLMYSRTPLDNGKQFMPMLKVWEILDVQERIRNNNLRMSDAIGLILQRTDPSRLKQLEELKLSVDDVRTRIEWLDKISHKPTPDDFSDIDVATGGTHTLTTAEFEDVLLSLPEVEREPLRMAVAAAKALPQFKENTLSMMRVLDERRAWLKNEMDGKAALVGFTATGRLDVVPTSLLPSCPGPVVHGVVFNAIMTGDVWSKASPWITRGFTLLVGLIATAIVAYFHPVNALLSSIATAIGYSLFNGLFLFDYHNYVVGMAGPLVTILLVWSGCTLMRFIVERAERRHIENRFRSYVDPALVNFVIENPDKIHLEGESRELTVVFTDLAGFTTLSEKLKERVVPILNEYMARMVNIIRNEDMPSNRRGYRNKFLGDGIMFFFGAPYHNATHAVDAVSTVLQMQIAMFAFNNWLAEQNLTSVSMRAGISTGQMVVGDAGSPDASDYTVLGDDVNFGARLESANKATGTLVMMSQRTRELCGDLFLVRPIARLQVVGKTESAMVYEPICYREDATPEQLDLVERTASLIEAFTNSKFQECIEKTHALEAGFGHSKLAQLYRRQSENFLAEPPGADFNGTIALLEK